MKFSIIPALAFMAAVPVSMAQDDQAGQQPQPEASTQFTAPDEEAVAGCPENTPPGRSADPFLDCRIKVGMTKAEVRAALGGEPTRTGPGQGGDEILFFEFTTETGATIIATVVVDKKGKVKFWRSYISQ